MIPTFKPYSPVDALKIVSDGFTELLLGSRTGNKDATVEPKAPIIKTDEKIKADESFLKYLALTNPVNPIKTINGNNHNTGY
jgi:hypothetical protein